MNSAVNKILTPIFNRCNRPQGLSPSLSMPISNSRFPTYHSASVEQRLQLHNNLEVIESAVPGFKLIFSSSGFDDIPLLKRIEVEDCKALLIYCGEAVINDEILHSIEQLNNLEINLPEWSGNTVSDISNSWLEGKTAFGCSASNFKKLADALKFVSWYFSQESALQQDMRTISVSLYSDSKRLESILTTVARILAPITPEAIQTEKPKAIMEYWGISKYPPSFRFKANVMIQTRRGDLDSNTAWPYLEVPPDGIITVSSRHFPDYILFIENKTTFERYSREIEDNGWIFYTNGFPSRRWQTLFKNIVELTPKETPVYHWGDLDEGGYRILSFMTNLLQRNIIPHMMLHVTKNKPSKYIDLQSLAKIIEHETTPAIKALHKEILQLMESTKEIPWVEQEALPIKPPQ